MTWKRGLLGALVAVALLAGGVLVYRQFFGPAATPEAAATPAPPSEAIAVPNDGAVSAEGQIVPARQADLVFSVSGVVAEYFVAEGESVAAGDRILRLDDTEQQLAVERAQAAQTQAIANRTAAGSSLEAARTNLEAVALDVTAAEVELALARAEPRPEEIALSEAQVALAEARLAQATAAQALVLEGVPASRVRAAEAELRAAEARAIPPRLRLEQERLRDEPDADALAQAERDYNAALAAVAAAQQALDELAGGATADQQSAAASGVNAAAAQRDAAAAELEALRAGHRPEEVAIAEARLAAARAAEAEAQARYLAADRAAQVVATEVTRVQEDLGAAFIALQQRTLVAPFDGTVADFPFSTGEVIGAGVPAAILADFSSWLVETTDLTELDVAEIATGAPAQVRADALPDLALSGVVTGIAPIAREVRGDTTYRVTIRLDDVVDTPLRWGMTVFTSFGEDAPVVSPAVTGESGAVRAEGQLLPEQSAALSFQMPGRAILTGVNEGDRVVKGQELILLDAAELVVVVRQAEAAQASAEAALDMARAEVNIAQAQRGAAEAGVMVAEAQLALAQAGARPEQLAAAERGVAAASAGVAQASAERDAALDVSDAAVRAAEAQLAAAQAQLTALQDAHDTILTTCVTLPDGSEVCPLLGAPEENARAQVAAAEATAGAAQLALDEARAGATAAERRVADAAVGVAAAQRAVAEAQRDLLAAGARAEEIRLAEIGVEQARLGLTAAEDAVAGANAALAQAEAGVAGASAGVGEARSARDRAVLTAPFAGTVAERLVEDGEWVAPGVPVVQLGSAGWVVETTDLVELDVVHVAAGQSATVTFDALPGETLRGTVVDVGRVPIVTLGDVTYRVRIALDDAPAELPLRWGMTALVSIDTP